MSKNLSSIVLIVWITLLWSHTSGLSIVNLKEYLNTNKTNIRNDNGIEIVLISIAQNISSAVLSCILGAVCFRFGIVSMGTLGKVNSPIGNSNSSNSNIFFCLINIVTRYASELEYISISHLIGNMTMNWLILMKGGSMALILKLMEPLATIVLSYVMLNKSASALSILFVLMTIVGVGLLYHAEADVVSTAHSNTSIFYPVILMASVSSFPLRNVLSKRVEVTGIYLYCCLSCICAIILSLLLILLCVFHMVNYEAFYLMIFKIEFLKASFYFAVYNILSYVLLSLVDPVSHSVLGISKRCYSICLSLYYLNDMEVFSTNVMIGLVLVLNGLLGYAYVKLHSGVTQFELLFTWSVLCKYRSILFRCLGAAMVFLLIHTCQSHQDVVFKGG